MLDFYLKNKKELLGRLSFKDVKWLSKMRFVKEAKTGFLSDDGPEALPFFDDYELSVNNLKSMKAFAIQRLDEVSSNNGYRSDALLKYLNIIDSALKKNQVVIVVCD